MRKPVVGVIDYGVGNLASLKGTLTKIGVKSVISRNPIDLSKTNLLLLPGVGTYPAARDCLRLNGLDDLIHAHSKSGKPVIGICLGMQLLADESSELVLTQGLGLIPGKVTRIKTDNSHTGWNKVTVRKNSIHLKSILDSPVYFNHSYHLETKSIFVSATAENTISSSIIAMVQKDNTVGVQFHPEKSQLTGQLLLKSLVDNMSRVA